jgi:hypothetical protein
MSRIRTFLLAALWGSLSAAEPARAAPSIEELRRLAPEQAQALIRQHQKAAHRVPQQQPT